MTAISSYEIARNILIAIGMGAASFCLVSLIRMRIGHYIIDASKEDVLKRLIETLESQGVKIIKVDMARGIVTTLCLAKIIDVVLYVFEGNRVKYIVKDIQGTKVSLDIIAYRACLSWRLHFTEEEWRKYGYAPELVETVVQKLMRIHNE